MAKKPFVMVILDGWGTTSKREGNAIALAKTPNFSALMNDCPHVDLEASGAAVGLPDDLAGNSEAGHMTIGTGRIVEQEVTIIDRAITDRSFFANPVLTSALDRVQSGSLHLIGLLSDCGIHSKLRHLYALLEMAKERGLSKVFIHAITDGHDVSPQSTGKYFKNLAKEIKKLGVGEIASIVGREYAMDRRKRWDRVGKAYEAIVMGEGRLSASWKDTLETAYANGETDELLLPTVMVKDEGRPLTTIENNDTVIFFNLRSDRNCEFVHSLLDRRFLHFQRRRFPRFNFVSLTEIDQSLRIPIAYPTAPVANSFSEYLARVGKRQVRIAETEKYPHITFFANGRREAPFPSEDRIFIPSARLDDYAEKPEMCAGEITDKLLERLEVGDYNVYVVDLANADSIAHTGKLGPTILAVEFIDKCLGRIYKAVKAKDGVLMVTADHGNAEQMLDGKRPNYAHSKNPVPLILYSSGHETLAKEGLLSDIVPTLLDLMGEKIPPEMTGRSLLVRKESPVAAIR